MRRPVSRPRRPTRRGQKTSLWIWVVVGLIVVGLVAALAFATIATSRGARYDKVTLCDTRGPSAVTVVLIDATDRMSAVQRTAVLNRLARLNEKLVANERLAIFEISPNGDLLKPKFSMCRPTAASETSELTGNKKLATERFEKLFNPAVGNALGSLLSATPAEKSPIMEAVQAASVSAFQAVDVPPKAAKRLIVVSDMLEYGEAGSHYKGVPDFDTYRASPQFARATSDLSGVEVIVLYIRRDTASAIQGLGHVEFWARWFSAQGADFRAIPVEG